MCFMGPEHDLSWQMFPVSLRIFILLPLDEAVYRCQLHLVDWYAIELNGVLADFLPSESVYFWQRGVEVCNYNSRFVCFSSGSYIWFCLVNFYTLLLGRYTLKIIRSSWRIDPIVIMECSSLYLLTPFALRSVCLTLKPLLWLSLISISVVSLSPSICFYSTCVFVCGFVHACVLSHVGLWSHGLWSARLLCPWDSQGRNIRMGCYFPLQGIILTQGLNLCLLSPSLFDHWYLKWLLV